MEAIRTLDEVILEQARMNGPYRDPERLDYPSLSSFHRYSLCHISFQLSLLAPPSKDTKYSISGTAGHKAIPDPDYDRTQFSRDEIDTIEACKEQEEELIQGIAGDTPIAEVIREKRIWYSELGERLFSGQPDLVVILDDKWRTSIILDYKLGLLRAPPSSTNLQLRGATVAVWQNYGSRRSFVSIIQPRVSKWSQPALYKLEHLQQARSEIKDLMAYIHSPDATANPSAEACRHCAAKLICKDAYKPSQHLVTHRKEMIQALDDPTLSRLGELALQANIISKTALEELKERVTDRPDDFPAWYLQGTGSNSRIDDALAAFASLSDLLSEDIGEAKELFNGALETSLTDIVDAVRRHTGWSKKDARTEVERRLGALLIRKPKSPSLKRKAGWNMVVSHLEIEGVER